ncbi:CCA tRNA nucleotidyltransferase [Sporolactobacillus shoreicorticis]|uniref:CCA-adding enzyme n=1 Tax=Sporolactobacillus shoreicorticis TaxID=1923877 RepID=A0ABW5S659_9BACL|nr:CCA tRNA nucleotidyltransferase [Sporolactobacillus shoreicorticis]MCO7125777.1 CCA tRNA nucleotidyltransferase [Sporolactobacillus shoreicorticis]
MTFPFKDAAFILDRLQDHGFEAYVVGGAVRDYLLNRPIHDVDIATSAHPADVVSLFKRTVPIGIDHGTVAVLNNGHSYEVTTFRSESDYDDYRHPNQVVFVLSLEKDLMRRDFTINALAMDRDGKIIDLFEGKKDINCKRIRTVGRAEERITEDPLRMMRGMRFASELCFTLGQTERHAFHDKADLLKKISIERINQEMTRLLAGEGVSDALGLLFETHCIYTLPMLKHADEKKAVSIHYKRLQKDEERWTAFLISQGIEDVFAFAKSWKWSNDERRRVARLVKWTKYRMNMGWNKESVYFAGICDVKAINRLLASFDKIDEQELSNQQLKADLIWENCPIHSRAELAANGNHFINWSGEKPGPWLAKAIKELEREVVNGRVNNDLEAIRSWFENRQTTQKKQS